ncbi:MAG TPA: hypothetical protein VHT34_04820 [Clostridia bacterium]|nr:hypothetical protein [Clostridia bacterium]
MKEFLDQFKRNRYFYGKLLTVRDFLMEQEYFNGKRYLNNLLVNGSGVVSGLDVSYEGNSLKVSRGMAIDSRGREIVINQDIELDVSRIEGFFWPTSTQNQIYHLCIKYAEDNKEAGFPLVPANSPDAAANPCCKSSCAYCEEFCEHNSIQEGYKFHLRLEGNTVNNGPELMHINEDNLLTSSAEVYYDASLIKITRIVPKWVNPEEAFPVILRFQKLTMGNIPDIEVAENFSLGVAVDKGMNTSDKVINISDKDFCHSSVVEKTYFLRTDDGIPNGTINTADLKIGNEKKGIGKNTNNFGVIEENIFDKIVKEYNKGRGFGAYVQSGENLICLAEIRIAWASKGGGGDFFYNITGIEEHTQYVYNNELLFKLISSGEKRLPSTIKNYIDQKYTEKIVAEPGVKSVKSDTSMELIDKPQVDVKLHDQELDFKFKFPKESATGTVRFDIGSRLYAGDKDISVEIDPGLGHGPICVQLAIENEPGSIYINPAQYELGASVKSNSGKLQVWYKARTDIAHVDYVRIRWWAFKVVDSTGEISAKGLTIIPKNSVILPGQTIQFKALINGAPSDRVVWAAIEHTGKQKFDDLLSRIRGEVHNLKVNQNILEIELEQGSNFGSADKAPLMAEFKLFASSAVFEKNIIRIPLNDAGSIDNNGFYKAPNKAGNYIIIGVSTDNARIFGTANVTVKGVSSGTGSAGRSGGYYTSNSIGLNNIYGRVYAYSPGGNPGH